MKVGIFGGTFNPPHIGHIESATVAAGLLGLDKLIIVPAGEPPHKSLPDGTPPREMRLRMVRDAFESLPFAEIYEEELNSPGPSYTADTAEAISHAYPGAEIFLLVGTDMYLTLDTWKDSERLLALVTPAVFSRSPDDSDRISDYAGFLKKQYNADTIVVKNNVVDISSSHLREILPNRGGLGYITDTIYEYIIKNRFYNAKPNCDWLRSRAHAMLAPERVPHVIGCEKEAARLAERWDSDIGDALEAAILHDITKKLTPEENVCVLEEHGIHTECLAAGEEKLLHSKSGAALAKSLFGVSDAVAAAIMWHTTGRAGMSALEKVIYLADYIEPERDFPGIEALRDAAYADIDKAMIMGLEMSVDDMRKRGIVPNKTTFDALDDLKNSDSGG